MRRRVDQTDALAGGLPLRPQTGSRGLFCRLHSATGRLIKVKPAAGNVSTQSGLRWKKPESYTPAIAVHTSTRSSGEHFFFSNFL